MDEKMAALVGATAVATVTRKRLRPAAKLAMRGVVAASDATVGAGRGITRLYNEAASNEHSLRAAAKLAMRGVVVASQTTAGAGRGIAQLYQEVKAEQLGADEGADGGIGAPTSA
jgi:hypothetical protein